MKNLFKTVFLFSLMFCLASCEDDFHSGSGSHSGGSGMDVTPANINGTWQLSEWNGAPLAEGTYCYVVFSRRERTFEIYQKFDSMYARYITGTYSIEDDSYKGYVISGVYDYDNGDWNNDYVVTDLLESGSMVWTAVGDETDVCKYVRVDAVPDEIEEEARKEQGD